MTCLLTGASGGIGQAMAIALDKAGCILVLVGRDAASLEKLNNSLGNKHQILLADIATQEGIASITDAAENNQGLSMIIQAAGTSSFSEFCSQSAEHIRHTIELNLTVPMLLSRAVLPILETRKNACLVNVGSAFGSIGFAGFSSYCASKFGLRGFTEALQREYLKSNVSIKYFAPRATQTSFNSSAVDHLNEALGNTVDSPEIVAEALLTFLKKDGRRKVVGWPETFFCRLNGFLPGLVDNALSRKHSTIIKYAKQNKL